MSKSVPATSETRLLLYENAKKVIEDTSPILKEKILIKEILNKNTEQRDFRIFDALLSVSIYLLYVNIKLAVITKACLRPSLNYEKRFNFKRVNNFILEAYKYLYGYGKKKKKSLWITEIKPILKLIPDEKFHSRYAFLTNHIDKFGKDNITNLEQRNLSIHYDLEPLLVYNMLTNISEEKEIQRMIVFMDLLKEIQLFILEYIGKHPPSVNIINTNSSKYSFSFSDFNIFRDKKEELNLSLKESIQNNSNLLDSFCSKQKIPKLIKQKFRDIDNKLSVTIDELFEIQKVSIHLLYIYVDLATAMRNFIESEYSIEKQLSMSQINTIVVEGYNKIYGLNKSKNSFWKMYITPVVFQSKNKELNTKFKSIEQKLDVLKTKVQSFSEDRHLSIHLEQGIPKTYSMLYNLNPLNEFSKAQEMLNFMNQLLEFLNKCLYSIDERRMINHQKDMESTNKIIDDIINILRKFPYDLEVKENIKLLEKIKSGELLNEIAHKLFK